MLAWRSPIGALHPESFGNMDPDRRWITLLASCILARLAMITTCLIDGARDQAGHIFPIAKDERKGRWEGRRRLGSRERDFPHCVAVAKAENPFDLIVGDAFLDPDHVLVKGWALPESQQINKMSTVWFDRRICSTREATRWIEDR